MELRTAYKQTEAGLIPGDWNFDCIDRLAVITTGARNTQDRVDDGPYPFFVRSETVEHINTYSFDGEAVLTAGDGVGTGKVFHYIKGKFDVHQRVYRISNFSSLIDGYFFYLYFSTHFYNRIMQMTAKSSVDSVRRGMIAQMVVPLPPLPEQRAIAAALRDVDALMEWLSRLTAKKRDLKQATMEQLLTGQTRLPGFRGEWGVKTLGDLFTFSGGHSASRDQLSSEGLCYLHYGDIHGASKTYVDVRAEYQDIPKLDIPLKRVSPGSMLSDGDVVFVDASEDDEGTSRHVVVVNKVNIPFISGLHTIVAKSKTDEIAHDYRRYCFQTAAIQKQFLFYSVGMKVSGISKTNIAKVTLPVPAAAEQIAIAAILSDMDSELAALEARRVKTRGLKRAMMQELLTGRIRLATTIATGRRRDSEKKEERRANTAFVRSVLAAEIVESLHEQPTFGHVKLHKLIFLVERLCGVETGSTYHRKAAGPYDNQAMRSIDSQLRKQHWFDARKEGERYRYVPMENRGGHQRYFERYFAGVTPTVQSILATFKTVNTERCEIVATLFAAWEDLLAAGEPASAESIVHEVLTNWHEAKQRIPKQRWLRALQWMQEKGLTPKSAV